MELVNKTPVPARLVVAETEEPELRQGTLTAKVTYRFDAAGRVTLDTEDPVPILADDQPTKLGLLPRDDLPRRDDVFEVICLGSAHAPGGRAVEQMTVSLSVGDVTRSLLVTGDRTWQGERGELGPSAPAPFIRMPLSWARAFGGSAEVQLDPYTTVDTQHLGNPDGLGYDAGPAADALKQTMRCPDGYPRVAESRRLPNVEDPDRPIQHWDDEPEPACWATVPMTSATQAARCVQLPASGPTSPEAYANVAYEPDLFTSLEVLDSAFWRAAPAWIMKPPAPGARVVMNGLTPSGRVACALPFPDVSADYVVGADQGTVHLTPRTLVLLTDERRLYVVLKQHFLLYVRPGLERSIRLRVGQDNAIEAGGEK